MIDKVEQSFQEIADRKMELFNQLAQSIKSLENDKGKLLSEHPEVAESIKTLMNLVAAQEEFLGMVLSDMGTMLMQLKNLQTANLLTELKQQTALTVLKDKEIVTEEEFKEVWERDVMPELERMGVIKKKSNIIVPDKKIILP